MSLTRLTKHLGKSYGMVNEYTCNRTQSNLDGLIENYRYIIS